MKALTTVALLLLVQASLRAGPIQLQQATATFSQTEGGDYGIGQAIDGATGDFLGWAISPNYPNPAPIEAQTAVFETAQEVGFASGTTLTFTLSQTHTNSVIGINDGHNLGRFRLSITKDARASFADGLPTGGDVTANWIVLDPISFVSSSGTTLAELPDHSILASGPNPSTDVYTVTAMTTNTGITGVRLEALKDPSLPYGGPGRQPKNGNFVLTEFELSATVGVATNQLSIHNAIEICWLSSTGKVYQIQFTRKHDSGEWYPLGDLIPGTGNEICTFDSMRTREHRFYRVIEY